jgi:hypothetical protein
LTAKKLALAGGPVFLLVLVVLLTLPADPAPRPSGTAPVIGAKIYEYAGSFPALFEAWRSTGINTAFVSPALISNAEFRTLARKNGVALYIIFPVFFDADALANRPDLFAVTDKGARAEDDWVKFVCPTREDYRREKVEYLKKLVRETDPEGVSLDFIRFFVFWEKVYPGRTPESLPQSCFDESCLASFTRETGISIPPGLNGTEAKARWILDRHAGEWTEWKCGIVAGMVETLAAEARRIKPAVKVNVHTVPWRSGDFGGAIKAVAGQDLARMTRFTDFASPMCYHHMVKRPPSWVHDVVVDAARTSHVPLLPSIQVKEAYIPGPETPEEFREALVEALRPPSAGVVFWNWPALAESPAKLEAVKSVLKSQR